MGGGNFSHSHQCCILSVFILCFPLFPAPPRLQLILYSDEEVRAALEPLWAIPAFTDLLLTDPPAAPKRKCDKPAGDPKLQPQSSVPVKMVVVGDEPVSAEDKPIGTSDPATPAVLMEIGGQEQAQPVAETGTGAKPKAPSRKPRKAGKSAPAMEKGKILGKPPRPRPGPSAASLLPPLPDVLTMFMGCNTPDEFSSLLEYLQLNGGWFPFHVQRRGACQFAAFRRGIDCPMEYTNTHLRRQLVMEMIRYKEFFLPHLTDAISGGYGGKLSADEYSRREREGLLTAVTRQAYEEPGPFSYLTYLEHILKRDSWGDEITLVVLSMVFQLRITIVTVPSLHGDPIRHVNTLEKSDIVLLRSGGNHYLSAGMYACSVLFVVLFQLSSLLTAFVSVLKLFLLSFSQTNHGQGQRRFFSVVQSSPCGKTTRKITNVRHSRGRSLRIQR